MYIYIILYRQVLHCLITFVVSTPNVHITVPDSILYAGIHPLTLICKVSVNSTNNHGIQQENVNITWLRRDTPIQISDDRVAIHMPQITPSQPLTFISNITLFPSSIVDTEFTCIVRVTQPPSSTFIFESDVEQQTAHVSIQCK